MKKKHLDKTIKDLHAELKRTRPANDHVRGHIERLILEIDMLKEEPGRFPCIGTNSSLSGSGSRSSISRQNTSR